MMKMSTLLGISLSILLASASPIEKREIGGILICNGANATGICTHETYPMETCVDLPSQFLHNAATFAPDGEDFFCYPYAEACNGVCMSPEGCTAGAVSYDFEYKFDLKAFGGWDQFIASFECHKGKVSDFYTSEKRARSGVEAKSRS